MCWSLNDVWVHACRLWVGRVVGSILGSVESGGRRVRRGEAEDRIGQTESVPVINASPERYNTR